MRGVLGWHLGESRTAKEKQLRNKQQVEMRGELEAETRPRASDVGYGLLGQSTRRWDLIVLAGGKRRRHSSECRGTHAF